MRNHERPNIGEGSGEEDKETGEEDRGDDILGEIAEKGEGAEKMDEIEAEAWEEKKKREAKERRINEARERLERSKKKAAEDGEATYLAIKYAEKLADNRNDREKQREIKKEFEQKIEDLEEVRAHSGNKKLDAAIMNSSGKYLELGTNTAKMDEGFSREEYLKTLEKTKEIIDKWEEQNYWEERNPEEETAELNKRATVEGFEKNAEGFGRKALENEDLDTAIDVFNEAGILEKSEIATELKDKIEAMLDSGDKERRAKAKEAAEKISKLREESEA